MLFKKSSGALLLKRNSLSRVFANVFQRDGDRSQIPNRLATPVLQRPAAAKKSGEGGGVIVAGPAFQLAPLDRFILRVGKYQRTVLRECRRLERKENDHCRDSAENRKNQTVENQAWRPTPPHCEHHCPVSVAMTFQLGSREDTSRAKVQTSVTSVTLSGLPSITAPALSRVTEISLEMNRTVICADLPRCSAWRMSALSMETNRVSIFSPLVSRSLTAASKPSKT